MFSVIIPTLWKVDFREELIKLQKSKLIKEIIIINNNKINTPEWFLKTKKNKIKKIEPETNLFVNPSWNLGVNLAKSDYIILLNDDIKTKNYNFLNKVFSKLTEEDCLIGIEKSCYSYTKEDFIEFIDISNIERDLGFGCVMFFKKSLYKNIPDEYLIWRGDDFLIDLFKHRKQKIKTIKNLNLSNSLMSVSADSPEFSWKEEKEGSKEKYLNYLKEYLK